LSDDLQQLKTLKSGIWTELIETYRDLFPAKSTLSGFSNRYSKVFYAFPAAVTISGLGMLSDAIVCRVKWNDPDILHERDVMFGDNQQAAQKYVTEWRRNAIFKAIRAFQIVKRAKRSAFGEKSYFNLVDIHEKGNVPAIITNSPTPDDKVEKEDENDLDFAEAGQSRQ
jgi:hypothetical protein